MQKQEFNNLMLGKDAKWADFEDHSPVKKIMVTGMPISALRAEIQKHEVQIPEPTQKDIQEHIAKLRADGQKEAKIRRIIKKIYHIIVV